MIYTVTFNPAIDYVVQRKPLQFFAIVALAVTIHNSAIVFAPLYFVPIKKNAL